MDEGREVMKPYEPPAVQPIGRLEDITKAGSGGIMESTSGTGHPIFSQA